MNVNQELKSKYPWGDREWTERTRAVARLIPRGVSVLDLGGGMGNLDRYLESCEYLSLDRELWTDKTIKADFNAGEFPEVGTFQYVVAQGVIEYMADPLAFLGSIMQYGRILILTYRAGNSDAAMQHGRAISLPVKQLAQLVERAGWTIEFSRKLTKLDTIFYCTK